MISRDMYHWKPQACPICELPPAKCLGQRGGAAHRDNQGVDAEIWSCGKCGLIFPNPMPVPVNGLDQHYGLSPEDYFQHHENGQRDRSALRLLREAKSLLGEVGKLLDIGAGRGELLRVAQKEGWTAVGIETSSIFAKHASRNSGAEIRQEPIERCDFKQGEFDVVILEAVLEHLYNPDEVIKEISKLLRCGGILYIEVPNERGLYFKVGNLYQKVRRRDWVVNLSPTFPPFHLFGFSPKSLRALLSKHGLKPKIWKMHGGQILVPTLGGLIGLIERQTAKTITAIGNIGGLGTHITTWAVKL